MSEPDSLLFFLIILRPSISMSRVFPHSPVTETEEVSVFSSSNRPVRRTSPEDRGSLSKRNMKLVRVGFCLAVFFAFSVRSASALSVPKQPQGYVSDYAGMLSGSQRAELEEKLHRFEEETSNQVVVAAFPSLEGDSLEDFSIRLAEAWKIGRKGKDNGAILLIFKNDRKVRIEVGYGLEGALPDATCKLIIENEIVPRFRAGNFDEGIERAVDAILAATKGEYRAESKSSAGRTDYLGPAFLIAVFLGTALPILLLWLLFAVGMFLVGVGVFAGPLAFLPFGFLLGVLPLLFYFLFGRHYRGYSVLHRGGSSWNNSVFWGGGFGGGGFGGGGFGGGGGSFGGGGASGGW